MQDYQLLLLFLQAIWIKMEFYHREATRSCSCWYTLVQKVWVNHHEDTEGKVVLNIFSREIPDSVVQTKSDKVAAFDSRSNFCFFTLWSIQEVFVQSEATDSNFGLTDERLCSTELVLGSFTLTSYSAVEHYNVFILTIEHCFFKTFCAITQKGLPEGSKTETQVTPYLMQQESQEVFHLPKAT